MKDHPEFKAILGRQVDNNVIGVSKHFKGHNSGHTFSFVYGIEVLLPIEFGVESLRAAVTSYLTDNQSLNNRLMDLEELDERRRMAAQHIKAIQRRRKISFDKHHTNMALQPGMMRMIQNGKKLEFPDKFDAVWMGSYLVKVTFPNNSPHWRP